MRSILSSIMALFCSVFLLLLGNGLLSTLLVLRGVEEGFSEQYLGILTSMYFLGAFCATLMASKLIRRMGHIRCFTFCTALLACSTLAYVLFVSPVAWMVIRFLTGLAVFVMYTVVESWLNGQTQDDYRSRVFSIYTLINLLAASASQQLLLIDSVSGFILFILAGLLITASIMPVSATRLQQPNLALDMPKMSLRALYKAAPIAVTGCLVSGLIMGPFWGLTPLFANNIGFSDKELASFISLSILGGAIIQYPIGRLSDKMDRRKMLLMTFVGAMLMCVLLAVCSRLLPDKMLITGISAVFCGLVLAVYPVSVVHLVERIHKDHLVSGSSALLMVYGLGSFVGPALAGFFLQLLGVSALPIYYIVVFVIFIFVISVQLYRSRVIENPDEHEVQYVAMVRTSQNVLPLHPESEEELDAPPERRQNSQR